MAFTEFVLSVTKNKFVPKVEDNVLNGNLLTMRFLSNPKPWNGGARYQQPIKFQKSSAGGSYAGVDLLSTNQQNTRVRAYFDPKQNYFSVVLDGIQQAVNQGDGQILDLLATEMDSVSNDMADTIGDEMYSDGTGNSSKDITGLAAAINDGNAVATYGDLARGTYTTWLSTLTSNSGAITLANLRSAYDSAKHGNDIPTLIATTKAIWSTFESLLQATVNYYTQVQGYPKMTQFGITRNGNTGQTGDIGFDTLFFRGVPVVADEKCPSGRVYLINERHLFFAKMNHAKYPTSKNGFAWTGLKEPINQDAEVGQFFLYGNVVADSCRVHSYMTSKS